MHRRLQLLHRLLVPRRYERLLSVSVLVLAALAGCGGDAKRRAPVPDGVLAITTPPDASTTVLARVDGDTLEPRQRLDLGEYHEAWAYSPDGERLAVGTFKRTGVRLVDVASLKVIRDVPMPIAAVGVGWLGPDTIAVLLQRGGVVLVDAPSGRVTRRFPMAYRRPCAGQRQAVLPDGVVFAVTGADAAIRLLRLDRAGNLRVAILHAVRAPTGPRTCGSPGFAVDPSGRRAVVVAGSGPIADVDLGSLRVTYRPGTGLAPRAAACGAACPSRRTAVWPSPGTVAIAGSDGDERAGAEERPAGAALVDVATWTARRVDARAAGVAATRDGGVLTFGGGRTGVAALGPDGRRRWTALRGVNVRSAVVAGGRLYVLDHPPRAMRVLDARTGRVVSRSAGALMRLDVLAGRRHSGG